jgi:hypothetical protein
MQMQIGFWQRFLTFCRLLRFRLYKRTIFPAVLSGCENSSLTLREEHRLRATENRALRRISGRKRRVEEIIRMEKLRRMREAWHAVCNGGKRNAYRPLVGKSEGRRPRERRRRERIY